MSDKGSYHVLFEDKFWLKIMKRESSIKYKDFLYTLIPAFKYNSIDDKSGDNVLSV